MPEIRHIAARPWWRKKRTWFIGLVSMLAAASLWMQSYNEAEPGGLVRTQIGGYKSAEGMGLFPISLFIAMRKFPTYDECVEFRDDGIEYPNWAKMTSEAQIKVCTYWIAKHFKNIEKAKYKFSSLGLRSLIIEDSISIVRLELDCVSMENKCDLPPVTAYLLWIIPVKPRYGISLTYQNAELINVELSYEFV